MRKTVLCLCLIGCRDEAPPEASATKRCETLLAAQELNRLPEKHRADRRAAIRPRISDSDNSMFVSRSYDRLMDNKGAGNIEARDNTCTVDKEGRQGRYASR